MRRITLIVAAAALAACGSAQVLHERGWIGGETAIVVREGGFTEPPSPALTARLVIGMPEGVPQDSGLLLTALVEESPLHRAGLRVGDLILSLDGEPACDPLELREAAEAMEPGTSAAIRYWRGGSVRTADVTVGTETYRRQGTIGIGLAFRPVIDLWPFDDGIDVLGIAGVTTTSHRAELNGPEWKWLRESRPGEEIRGPSQERTDFRALPLFFGFEKRVVSQEP